MVWIILIVVIIFLLGFDMLVLHNKNQVVNNKKATIETIFWVSIALSFSIIIRWIYQNGWVANVNSEHLDRDKFWTIENGKRVFTPLFAALIMIELTDSIAMGVIVSIKKMNIKTQ